MGKGEGGCQIGTMRNALGKINDSVLHALEVMKQLTVKGKNLRSKSILFEMSPHVSFR